LPPSPEHEPLDSEPLDRDPTPLGSAFVQRANPSRHHGLGIAPGTVDHVQTTRRTSANVRLTSILHFR
jgi:hypothetical protein